MDLPEYQQALRLRQSWCEGAFAIQKWSRKLTRVLRRGLEAEEDQCWDGSIREMFTAEPERRGFTVERYDPFRDDLHGTAHLPKDRLTLTVLHYPHASNQTTVRVNWSPKHALEIPRFVHEEHMAVVSLANPYHLQDVPRARTFINAYTATRATIKAVAERLCGEAPFQGENPVDPFCGLFDTRL